MLRSDEKDCLSSQVKSLAATNIAASHHVVDADHIGACLGEGLTIVIIGSPRNLRFLCPNHPANRKTAFLAATRTSQRDLFGLFFFIVEPFFINAGLAFFF